MHLLTTKLTNEQAEIVLYFRILEFMKIVDTSDVEVFFDTEELQFRIDWLYLRKEETWIVEILESTGGTYWEPSNIEELEVLVQKENQRLSEFVEQVLLQIIKDRFNQAFACEAESVDYHRFKNGDYELPY